MKKHAIEATSFTHKRLLQSKQSENSPLHIIAIFFDKTKQFLATIHHENDLQGEVHFVCKFFHNISWLPKASRFTTGVVTMAIMINYLWLFSCILALEQWFTSVLRSFLSVNVQEATEVQHKTDKLFKKVKPSWLTSTMPVVSSYHGPSYLESG